MSNADLNTLNFQLGPVAQLALALVLATMMFAVALGLRREHFAFFKHKPRIYLGGVGAQLIGLPIMTVALCYIFNPTPSVALGMILVACCPGGNVSNLLALYARANTALSVSLTATSSLAAAFLTPVSILFWSMLYGPTRNLLTEINLDIMSFLAQTLVILALPLTLGMCTAHLKPTLATRVQKPLALIAGIGLIIIIGVTLVQFLPALLTLGIGLFALVILHNSLAFSIGWLTGHLTGADIPSRRALTIEVGIQNSGLGIVILLTQLQGLGGAGAVAGLWGTWHVIAGLALVTLYTYQDKREKRTLQSRENHV